MSADRINRGSGGVDGHAAVEDRGHPIIRGAGIKRDTPAYGTMVRGLSGGRARYRSRYQARPASSTFINRLLPDLFTSSRDGFGPRVPSLHENALSHLTNWAEAPT